MYLLVIKYNIDTKEKDQNSTDFALQQFRTFVSSAADSGISLSRDLRLQIVDEVIAQAVTILTEGTSGTGGTGRKYKIVDAKTCLGYEPYAAIDSASTATIDPKTWTLPAINATWSNANTECEDFLK